MGSEESSELKETEKIFLIHDYQADKVYAITSNGILQLREHGQSTSVSQQIDSNFKAERQRSLQVGDYRRVSHALDEEFFEFKGTIISDEDQVKKETTV